MAIKNPNLLFVFTDQQRLDTLACYGNNKLQMPNLNRLADSAVVFEQPHCTQPVCTPSRGSLMTGLMPHAHGAPNNNILLNADARCLPELLDPEKRAHYHTAYMGKWHLGDEIFAQHGFEQWLSTESYTHYFSSGRDRSRRSSYYHFLMDAGFVPARPEGGEDGFSRDFACRLAERYGKPHFLGSRASEFIRDNEGRPWMLAVNFLEPHGPFQSPRDLQYDPEEVDLSHNWRDVPGDDQPAFLKRNQMEEGPLRRVTARYWGMNSLVDTHVGRILDALDATGQRDNTIIVFTSDHGEMMGAHGLMSKGVMFKEAVQVPMLLQLPGQKAQGRIAGPVSQIDLVPTLLELMGEQSEDKGLHGQSLAGLCREASEGQTMNAEDGASPCVIEWNPGKQACKAVVRTIVTRRERYSHYSNGEEELYDLQEDPREVKNLAGDSSRRPRIMELRAQLAAWQKNVKDTAEPIQS
ncbi:MAG: sulfatase-like hydrolase/transferase [Kiritimatiellia bacterium]